MTHPTSQPAATSTPAEGPPSHPSPSSSHQPVDAPTPAPPLTSTPSPTPWPTPPLTPPASNTPPADGTVPPCTPLLGIALPSASPVLSLAPPAWFSRIRIFDWSLCGFLFAAEVEAGLGWLAVFPTRGTIPTSEGVDVWVLVDPRRLPGTGEGLFTGRVRIDAGPAGSQVVDIQVSNVGRPPMIVRAEGRCAPDVAKVLVSVLAEDDYGVISASVFFGGQAAVLAQQPDGSWVALLPLDSQEGPGSAFILVYDGAGQRDELQLPVDCG